MHTESTLIKRQLRESLIKSFSKKAFTPDQFNKALQSFKYLPNDRHNKPQKLKSTCFGKKKSIIWTSAEAICFAKNSLKILSDLVDFESDPVWVCWAKHVTYLTTACRSTFTEAEVLLLNRQVIEHQTMFRQVFGPKMCIPKWHYVFHMALDILLNGPSFATACWKKETKHKMFKRWIGNTRFGYSVEATLALKHQRKVALDQYLSKTRGGVMNEVTAGVGASTAEQLDWASSLGELTACDDEISKFVEGGAYTCMAPQITWHSKLRHYGVFFEIGTVFLFAGQGGLVRVGNAQGFFQLSGLFFVSFYEYTSGLCTSADSQYVEMCSIDTSQLKLHKLASHIEVVNPHPKIGRGVI
jgi:hypothetical protein